MALSCPDQLYHPIWRDFKLLLCTLCVEHLLGPAESEKEKERERDPERHAIQA